MAELEERFRSVRMEHRNALLRGVGEQLAIASEAPYIPDAVRRLKAPEGSAVLDESFERSIKMVWGSEAARILSEAKTPAR